MRARALSCALVLATASPLAAQSAGTFEFGGFGRYAVFDDRLQLDPTFGGGGYLGLYLLRNLAVEAEGSYIKTSDTFAREVSSIPLRGRLMFNIPLGGFSSSLQLGAGYVYDLYRKSQDISNHGVTGAAGFRIGLTDHWAFRVNGTVDYVPSPDQPGLDHYWNWNVHAGLSILAGNRPADRDHDGVSDDVDRCPGTPRGESVDASGCSASQRDSDGDGVVDARDKCPGTPAGERVDADGCSEGQRDADRDGVPDASDKCPGTPAGESVDANGCSASQRDGDRDGVPDARDKCPNTPAGERVDADGCAESQRDADRDGVPDGVDKCPGTPAGQTVDANGCAASQRDGDQDGVTDDKDKCPSTPRGEKVDENGCPVLFEGKRRSVVLKGVNFETGKATLTEEARAVLRDVAQSLAANPEVRVEVQGHTDNVGSRAFNQRLSQARAQTVAEFLVANGVSPSQVRARGYGFSRPIASNKTAEGRAKNRRVELVRLR